MPDLTLLEWDLGAPPTLARVRRALSLKRSPEVPDGIAEEIARLCELISDVPSSSNPFGTLELYRVGRVQSRGSRWVMVTEDVRGRDLEPEWEDAEHPCQLLADHSSRRVLSRGRITGVWRNRGGDYWYGQALNEDWPAVLLGYLRFCVHGDRSAADWYLTQDPGFYPTTRSRTGPGSGLCRPAAPVDWSTYPALVTTP